MFGVRHGTPRPRPRRMARRTAPRTPRCTPRRTPRARARYGTATARHNIFTNWYCMDVSLPFVTDSLPPLTRSGKIKHLRKESNLHLLQASAWSPPNGMDLQRYAYQGGVLSIRPLRFWHGGVAINSLLALPMTSGLWFDAQGLGSDHVWVKV